MTKISGPNITIIGAGAWGTALGHVLAYNNHYNVTILGRDKQKIEQYACDKKHPYLGDDIALSPHICWSSEVGVILPKSDYIILAIPTQFLRSFFEDYVAYFPKNAIIIQTAKGIEITTQKLIHKLTEEFLPENPISLLSGPSFARDVAQNKPTAITIAAKDIKISHKVQTIFNNTPIRPYRTTDLEGVALCGALKNILAVACGFVVGYGLGESAKAALITRAFPEIQKFLNIYGGHQETFLGLSGVGDIILTCNSHESRNYDYGFHLGEAVRNRTTLPCLKVKTVEGVATLKALFPVIEEQKDKFPLFHTLSCLIHNNEDFPTLLQKLFHRPLKAEFA